MDTLALQVCNCLFEREIFSVVWKVISRHRSGWSVPLS